MFAVLRARRVAEIVALRLSLPMRLAREPLDALLVKLTSARKSLADDSNLTAIARDILAAERGVSRLPWVANTCLYRSLARYAVLRRAGMDVAFVMGLGPGGIVVDDGHAWIEVQGKPFEEARDVSRYTVTFRYPAETIRKSEEL